MEFEFASPKGRWDFWMPLSIDIKEAEPIIIPPLRFCRGRIGKGFLLSL